MNSKNLKNMVAETLIYEYKDNYFIIQRSTQGKAFNETSPSENAALYSKLSINCSSEQLGKDARGAIENYNKIRPQWEPWELEILNKNFCKWVGAKGRKSFDRDSRCVQIIKTDKLEIIPFDNCIKNEWYGPMLRDMGFKNKIITINIESDYKNIGENIKKAFTVATYNKERKM